jgi:hypothetical protein
VIQDIIKPSASTSAFEVFEVREVCAALSVSPSGFYAHRHKSERLRRCEDKILADELHSAFEQSGGPYSSPRLVRALRKRGLHTSKTRVRRLMKREGLGPRQKRRVRIKTTRSNPHLPVAPHLLLEAPPVTQPGERFYSDITYIPTQEGWLFTAATLDGYSRRCAGWSAADNMETPLVLRAAERALTHAGDPTEAKIHHSDRGSQYTSKLFRDFLKDNEVVQSMSRREPCGWHELPRTATTMPSWRVSGRHSKPSALTTFAPAFRPHAGKPNKPSSLTAKCFTIESECTRRWIINHPSSLNNSTCNKISKRSKTSPFARPHNQGQITWAVAMYWSSLLPLRLFTWNSPCNVDS